MESAVLGADAVPVDELSCGMPVSLQIERLRRELEAQLGGGFCILNADLYGLEGAERDAALDALVAGEPSPFVLVHGKLACTGAVEVRAVLEALA